MKLMALLWIPDLPEDCEVDLYLQKDQDIIHIGKGAWTEDLILCYVENSVIEFEYNRTYKILTVTCTYDN